MPITTYCTQADVQARLSAVGVQLRLDDNPADITNILESAAMDVNERAQLAYGVDRLATSDWVKFKARDLAVFHLCIRRNNPISKAVQFIYDSAIESLEKVLKGTLQIPDVAAPKEHAPVLSNMTVRPYPVPHPVAVPGTSTGRPSGYVQHVDEADRLDYGI